MRKLLLVFLLLTCALSACTTPGINGGNPNNDVINPGDWDNLGGGGTGDQTNENPITIEGIPYNDAIETLTFSDFIDTELEKISIDLNNLQTTDNYSFENAVLTITTAGFYELSGVLNGAVIIEGDAENIVLRLNNAAIMTKDSQPYPAITFKKHDGVRVLYVNENSTNYLSDSIGDNLEADEGNAVVQAKKSDLIIAGGGTLNIESFGEETTGIKVKKDLFIFNTTINIIVNDNGIKSGSTLGIFNANITITSLNDGIKTDVEAESLNDPIVEDIYEGFMYIENSNITVTSEDNGIDANSYLKINNTSEFTINVTTNGGAPNTITEYSSDNADGKAIRTSGIKYVDSDTENETDLKSLSDYNYLLVILGGNFIVNSNDDAFTSKGNTIIFDGNYNISTGNDAIHAEYITTIHNGTIEINKCYEGIEGASVEIYGGNITLTSADDGINAANADLTNYSYNIYVGGGNILVNAEGDGIDSNGTVEIAGGNLVIFGPTNSANAALDADRGILVNGGNLMALGPIGMIETPSANSTQCSIVYSKNSRQSSNTIVTIKDQDGNILFTTTALKAFQSIVVSLDSFVKDSTYIVEIGSTSQNITLNSILNTIGNTNTPGFGGPGGRPPR